MRSGGVDYGCSIDEDCVRKRGFESPPLIAALRKNVIFWCWRKTSDRREKLSQKLNWLWLRGELAV